MSRFHADESALVKAALVHVRNHQMEPWGLHGLAHWWRVRHNGLLIASAMGASARVVVLFSIFHDSHRKDNGHDPDHGRRAATWLANLRSLDSISAVPAFETAVAQAVRALSDADFRALHEACALHTGEMQHENPTVAACFIADRLDLSRVGFRPDPARMPGTPKLLTTAFIDAAIERQRAGLAWPGGDEIKGAWGLCTYVCDPPNCLEH